MSTTLFLGDSHASTSFVKAAIDYAKSWNISRVFSVGDFGWWPRATSGQRFIKEVSKYVTEKGIRLYWIPGNHEDWKDIETRYAASDAETFIQYQKSSLYLVRNGATWTWDNLKFGALGGAFSIDRSRRSKDWDWFEAEVPDESLIPGLGVVDVLITHEAPIVPPMIHASGEFRLVPESAASQDVIYRALMSAKPQLLIHGHWHHFERYVVAGATVQALDCNFSSAAYATCVLDSETKKLYTLGEFTYEAEGTELA